MFGILFLSYFICSGVYIVHRFVKQKPLATIWLGLSFGVLLAMVLPALFAFVFRFAIAAHLSAVGLISVLNALAYTFGKNHSFVLVEEDKAQLKTLLYLLIPFTLLMAYLQYSHNVRPMADGSIHTGQATYGDLPLHLSIITSAVNAEFPLEYSILSGTQLNYPFLIDTLSSSLYLLGASLPVSINIVGTLCCTLIFTGYFILANSMVSKKASVLAFLFLFINGGIGFLYHLDMAGNTLGENLHNILHGFYQTPTNQPLPHNLRWSNILVDMLLPQRTFMGGWVLLMPSLYLLMNPFLEKRLASKQELLLLVLFAGFMPLVNTHAFLALGIFSIAQMLLQTWLAEKETRKARFIQFVVFGVGTLAIALPQLIGWTFKQALGNAGFTRFHFNWVNNSNGLIDLYPWFYIKNIGIILLPLCISIFNKNKLQRSITLSAFAIFIVAELLVFQPNTYDNNKLLYVWFALCLPMACEYVLQVYHALHHIQGKRVIATIFLILGLTSGCLSIAREIVSDYQHFTSAAVEASQFTIANTEEHSMFITGTQHVNPIASLAGRRIIVGPDLWLYYHGLNTNERKMDVQHFYEQNDTTILEKYKVDYIYLSNYERHNYAVNETALEENYAEIFTKDDVRIFKVQP